MRTIAGWLLDLVVLASAADTSIHAQVQAQTEAIGVGTSQRCSRMTTLAIPSVTVVTGVDVAPGALQLPGAKPEQQRVLAGLPGFCRVAAVAKPTPDSDIHFEVWIPNADHWNRKFAGVGNGGYAGSIPYTGMVDALLRGYAAAGSDAGHQGDHADTSFVIGHPERGVDWGWRAVHSMTEASKLILRDYAGLFPEHSYFVGCSTGGFQGMAEAQRFPRDYDGILAGDPGYNRTLGYAAEIKLFKQLYQSADTYLTTDKLKLVATASMAACDAKDGVKDGIISDPLSCHFDPSALLCRTSDTSQCLTQGQVETVKTVYAGLTDPKSGQLISSGFEPGSEMAEGDPMGGWRLYGIGPSVDIVDNAAAKVTFFNDFVYHDPKWDWHSFNLATDLPYVLKQTQDLNAMSDDLSEFRASGGKLLMYQGWADPLGPPREAMRYFEAVADTSGGIVSTEQYFRLFMVPGMAHCGNGPGPVPSPVSSYRERVPDPEHDMFSALDRWVTAGQAPDSVIAVGVTQQNGKGVQRSRPLCPYPQKARWNGTGDPNVASSFSCTSESAPAQ